MENRLDGRPKPKPISLGSLGHFLLPKLFIFAGKSIYTQYLSLETP